MRVRGSHNANSDAAPGILFHTTPLPDSCSCYSTGHPTGHTQSCTEKLEAIKRDQAAIRRNQYAATTCPICFDDFERPGPGEEGAPGGAEAGSSSSSGKVQGPGGEVEVGCGGGVCKIVCVSISDTSAGLILLVPVHNAYGCGVNCIHRCSWWTSLHLAPLLTCHTLVCHPPHTHVSPPLCR
jgi:hypothetical protein